MTAGALSGAAATSSMARPALPTARGPLSASVIDLMRGDADRWSGVGEAAPYGADVQLALYLCYELHYRGFADVPDDTEWDLRLLEVRQQLEHTFIAALRRDTSGGDDLDAEVAALLVEPVRGEGPSWHLAREGTLEQLRDYVAMRSIYHLKEADPQAWVIPRLEGAAKAAIVSVEHDEYGAGRPERMHAHLFAEMMTELGLTPRYGAYLDRAPAEILAEVNLMSLCGLHRSLRGAAIGQFAVVELTSSPGSARLVRAARRLCAGPATEHFYAEHVEADAVHEQLLRHRVLAPMVADDPAIAADIVFGIQATNLIGSMVSERVLSAWRCDEHVVRRREPLRGGQV